MHSSAIYIRNSLASYDCYINPTLNYLFKILIYTTMKVKFVVLASAILAVCIAGSSANSHARLQTIGMLTCSYIVLCQYVYSIALV